MKLVNWGKRIAKLSFNHHKICKIRLTVAEKNVKFDINNNDFCKSKEKCKNLPIGEVKKLQNLSISQVKNSVFLQSAMKEKKQ